MCLSRALIATPLPLGLRPRLCSLHILHWARGHPTHSCTTRRSTTCSMQYITCRHSCPRRTVACGAPLPGCTVARLPHRVDPPASHAPQPPLLSGVDVSSQLSAVCREEERVPTIVEDDAMARIRALEKSISRTNRINAERHEQALLDDAIRENAPLRALHQQRLQVLSSTVAPLAPKSVIKRRILPTRCEVPLCALHEQCVARAQAQASTSAEPVQPDASPSQAIWPPKRLLRHPLPTREGKMRVLSTTASPFPPQPKLRECESNRPSPVPPRPKPPPTRASSGKQPRSGKLFPEESDEDLLHELNVIADTGKPSKRAIRAMQRRDRAAQNGERTPEESYLSHQRNVLRRQHAVAAAEASRARAFAERHDASHAQVLERMTQIVERSA